LFFPLSLTKVFTQVLFFPLSLTKDFWQVFSKKKQNLHKSLVSDTGNNKICLKSLVSDRGKNKTYVKVLSVIGERTKSA
jgi:hypothetical protein